MARLVDLQILGTGLLEQPLGLGAVRRHVLAEAQQLLELGFVAATVLRHHHAADIAQHRRCGERKHSTVVASRSALSEGACAGLKLMS